MKIIDKCNGIASKEGIDLRQSYTKTSKQLLRNTHNPSHPKRRKKAKKAGRKVEDDDIQTACSQSCPAEAITFGDMNNKGDVLDEKLHSDLNYIALEEINVRSSVTYTMKVNNRDEFMKELKSKGIATGIHYPITMSNQPAIKSIGTLISSGYVELFSIDVHKKFLYGFAITRS